MGRVNLLWDVPKVSAKECSFCHPPPEADETVDLLVGVHGLAVQKKVKAKSKAMPRPRGTVRGFFELVAVEGCGEPVELTDQPNNHKPKGLISEFGSVHGGEKRVKLEYPLGP